jgi:integrase
MRECGREFKYQCDTGSRSTLDVSRNHFAITYKRDRPRQPHRPVRRDFHAHLAAGDPPAQGLALRASRKGGALQDAGMTARALTARVRDLGAAVGLVGLSAHDLRHYWATRAARNGTPLDRLQDAGGWTSPAMPLRYVEATKIANQGVLLGDRT